MNRALSNLLGSFVPSFKKGFIEMKQHVRHLEFRVLLTDFFSVARSVGFVGVPAFLVGAIFLLLPQGRDTLLLVIEKLSEYKPVPLLFLLVTIGIWSVFSEHGVRYSIYIADNSGRNLSDDRVNYRKTVQKSLAGLFLLWPFAIVIAGLIWALLDASYMTDSKRYFYFGICIVMVYWEMAFISNLYFEKSGGYGPGRSKRTRFGARALPAEELFWLNKLYGMYEDFVYEVRKASSYKGVYHKDLEKFTNHFTKDTPEFMQNFPQDPDVMQPLRIVPELFELTDKDKIITPRGELYKWTYRIPAKFYREMHRRVRLVSLISVGCFLLFCLIPVKWDLFGTLGAPGLLCLAFACYSGMYTGLLYLDYSYLRNWKISVRLLIVVLLAVSSYINEDHPVRQTGPGYSGRNGLLKQFSSWYGNNARKSGFPLVDKDTGRTHPVVFICSEGGALRTGAFTALYLSNLQDSLQNQDSIDFKSSVFGMSGVSGGALGLGFYNAITFKRDLRNKDNRTTDEAKRFFQFDSLSPIIAKMFYGDFLNLFIPWHVELFDRSIALEDSWEMAYRHAVGKAEVNNYFSEDFMREEADTLKPVLAINTTEIETGLQCVVSNVKPDSFLFKGRRDLLAYKLGSIRYGTAVNFSTRFPLFSPGAKIGGSQCRPKYHYLDGGYVENTGSATMLEMLQSLEKYSPAFKHVYPIVINLRFSDNSGDTTQNISAGNELTEIVNGIYNTRGGRSSSSLTLLKKYVHGLGGMHIDVPLSSPEKNVPMNWVLSEQSMDFIMKDVEKKLSYKGEAGVITRIRKSGLKFVKYVPLASSVRYEE